MSNSYEHSYQHDLDDVIDVSDAVLAIGTEKVDTTTLKDRSLTGNDGTIHGAMPSSGYFLGQRFDGFDDYLDCENDGSLQSSTGSISLVIALNTISVEENIVNIIGTEYTDYLLIHRTASDKIALLIEEGNVPKTEVFSTLLLDNTKTNVITITQTGNGIEVYINGVKDTITGTDSNYWASFLSLVNTSGSFNKTDGLKCTSAGTIIFSNSFEFDGSEYITLVIDGIEYSGTTTVTQGTITATIAQGSNDITIDMGTGDVLPDIRVQFREEV